MFLIFLDDNLLSQNTSEGKSYNYLHLIQSIGIRQEYTYLGNINSLWGHGEWGFDFNYKTHVPDLLECLCCV